MPLVQEKPKLVVFLDNISKWFMNFSLQKLLSISVAMITEITHTHTHIKHKSTFFLKIVSRNRPLWLQFFCLLKSLGYNIST